MSMLTTCSLTTFSDDNDAAKKYKNNFVLSDAIGNHEFHNSKYRNNLSKNA
jgi:hypothetical protein